MDKICKDYMLSRHPHKKTKDALEITVNIFILKIYVTFSIKEYVQKVMIVNLTIM